MHSRLKAEIFLASITVIWGSTFTVTKSLLHSVSPLLYIGIRFTAASLVFALLFRGRLLALNRGTFLRGALLGALLFLGLVLQTVGLQFTSASKSAFLTGMLVVFTPILQLALERMPPRRGNLLGIGLVIAGLYFLTSPRGSAFNHGDLLTLGCAFVFALYIVLLDTFSKNHGAIEMTAAQFITAGILGIIAAATLEQPSFTPSQSSVGSLAYMVLAATVPTIYIQTKYQPMTTPSRSAVIFSLEPVVAAVIAAVVLGEKLGATGILGGALIVGGLLASELMG